MKKKSIILFTLIIIMIFLSITSASSSQDNIENTLINRVIYINYKWCLFKEELTKQDKITKKQATKRIKAIKYWAKEFNHMYDIDYQQVVIDITAIAELETGFVNWNSKIKSNKRSGALDNGDSFGIFSMKWETAYWIAQINNWELEDRYDEVELINNPNKQAKFAVWYYYWLLQQKKID